MDGLSHQWDNFVFRLPKLKPTGWDLKIIYLGHKLNVSKQKPKQRKGLPKKYDWDDRVDRVIGSLVHRAHWYDESPWERKVGQLTVSLRNHGMRKTYVTRKQIRELLIKQNYKCALTGRELTPDNTTGDHIIPLSRGGERGINNIQLVTMEANRAKGTMDNKEFLSLCRSVVKVLSR